MVAGVHPDIPVDSPGLMPRCSVCGEPLVYAWTPDGRKVRVNPEPGPDGLLVLYFYVDMTGHPVDGMQHVHTAARCPEYSGPKWTSHRATCKAPGERAVRP